MAPSTVGPVESPQMHSDGCGGGQRLHAAQVKEGGYAAAAHIEQQSMNNRKVPVLTMLPLDTVTASGFTYQDQPWFAQSLHLLAQSGAHGVAVDVWWGAVEREPRAYNWSGYKQLFEVIKKTGLKAQVVLGFHACGCNVGDNTQIPLPPWVLQCGDHDPDLFFTDKPRGGGLGQRNREYLSIWADDAPGVLMGRSPMQCYEDFMVNFRDAFCQELGTLIEEVLIGSGPCGELRYPSYVEAHGWKFPGVGEFQCYDRRALASLAQAAREAGNPDWGYGGPHNAGGYCSNPEETEFFAHQGSWDTQYGRFFLRWYSRSLLRHGEQLMAIASRVFARHTRRRRRHLHQQPVLHKQQQQQQQQQRWPSLAAGALGVQGPPTLASPAPGCGVHHGQPSPSAHQGAGGWQGGGSTEPCAPSTAGLDGGGFLRSRTSLGGSQAQPHSSPHQNYNRNLHNHQHRSLQRASYGGTDSSGRPSWGLQLSNSGGDRGDLSFNLPHSPHSHSQLGSSTHLGSPHYLSGRPVSMTLVASSSSMASGGGGGGGGGNSSSFASNLHAAGGGSNSSMAAAAAAATAALPNNESGLLAASNNNNASGCGGCGGGSSGGLGAGNSSQQPLVSSRSVDAPLRSEHTPFSDSHTCGSNNGGVHHRSGGAQKSLSGNNMADAASAAAIATQHQHQLAGGSERAGEDHQAHAEGAENGHLAERVSGQQQQLAGAEEVGHAGSGSSGNKSAWVQDGLGTSGSKARLAVRSSGSLLHMHNNTGSVGAAATGDAAQGMPPSQPMHESEHGGGEHAQGHEQGGVGGSLRNHRAGSPQLPLHMGGGAGDEGCVPIHAGPVGAFLSEGDGASFLGGSSSHNFLYSVGGGSSLSNSSAGGSMQDIDGSCAGGAVPLQGESLSGLQHGSSSMQDTGAEEEEETEDVPPWRPAIHLAIKVAGIHWWYQSRSHAAELTAGYYNTAVHDGYAPIVDMCAQYGVGLTLTCVEMCDGQHPLPALCGPEGLLKQLRCLTSRAQVPLSGENALPIFLPDGTVDSVALERIVLNARAWGGALPLPSSQLHHPASTLQQQQHTATPQPHVALGSSHAHQPTAHVGDEGWGGVRNSACHVVANVSTMANLAAPPSSLANSHLQNQHRHPQGDQHSQQQQQQQHGSILDDGSRSPIRTGSTQALKCIREGGGPPLSQTEGSWGGCSGSAPSAYGSSSRSSLIHGHDGGWHHNPAPLSTGGNSILGSKSSSTDVLSGLVSGSGLVGSQGSTGKSSIGGMGTVSRCSLDALARNSREGLARCVAATGLKPHSYSDLTEPLPALHSFTFLRLGPELLQPSHQTPWLRFMLRMQHEQDLG